MKTGIATFRQLFGDGNKIEIPVIQRDYAQGRRDPRTTEIRERLLGAFYDALTVGSPQVKPVDLDFVYGRWTQDTTTLEPLDGQQRLTTLFLLHWYLACLDGSYDDFQSWITRDSEESCFTYRTRPAAREFFDSLVKNPAPFPLSGAGPSEPSQWIMDAVWFVRHWRRDPTVLGCLTMLDAIHSRFATCKGLWQKLMSAESPPIIFHVLLLEEFNLADDLYVKMNARGKGLTDFEVFKAEIEGFVGNAFGTTKCIFDARLTWKEFASRQFDVAWTDWMWKRAMRTSVVDDWLMHLVRAIAIVHSVRRNDDLHLATQIERLLDDAQPGVNLYEEIGLLDPLFVQEMFGVLETFSNDDKAPNFLGKSDYLDEDDLLRRILLAGDAKKDDGVTLVDWVKFFGWCSFLIQHRESLRSPETRTLFNDWIRIAANLAHNSDIDRVERLITALRGLRDLSKSLGPEFLSNISEGDLDSVGGFNEQQQHQEKLKAQLILRSPGWRSLIAQAEAHPYFRGDIGFLLRFCGLHSREVQEEASSWSDEEDADLQRKFADWYERTCSIFPERATAWPIPFKDWIWERALLANGNYLLKHKRNLSLLNEKDRDASWRRLLADTRATDRLEQQEVVRRTLERVDVKNVAGSLEAIIAEGIQGEDDRPAPGLRRRLVENPRLIGYCEERLIRVEDGTVFLLATTRRSGRHVDLYIYDLYLRLDSKRKYLAPFERLEFKDTSATYVASKVELSTNAPGTTLTVEKVGAMVGLRIEVATPERELGQQFSKWSPDSEMVLRRNVHPDEAEAAVLETAIALRRGDFET